MSTRVKLNIQDGPMRWLCVSSDWSWDEFTNNAKKKLTLPNDSAESITFYCEEAEVDDVSLLRENDTIYVEFGKQHGPQGRRIVSPMPTTAGSSVKALLSGCDTAIHTNEGSLHGDLHEDGLMGISQADLATFNVNAKPFDPRSGHIRSTGLEPWNMHAPIGPNSSINMDTYHPFRMDLQSNMHGSNGFINGDTDNATDEVAGLFRTLQSVKESGIETDGTTLIGSHRHGQKMRGSGNAGRGEVLSVEYHRPAQNESMGGSMMKPAGWMPATARRTMIGSRNESMDRKRTQVAENVEGVCVDGSGYMVGYGRGGQLSEKYRCTRCGLNEIERGCRMQSCDECHFARYCSQECHEGDKERHYKSRECDHFRHKVSAYNKVVWGSSVPPKYNKSANISAPQAPHSQRQQHAKQDDVKQDRQDSKPGRGFGSSKSTSESQPARRCHAEDTSNYEASSPRTPDLLN